MFGLKATQGIMYWHVMKPNPKFQIFIWMFGSITAHFDLCNIFHYIPSCHFQKSLQGWYEGLSISLFCITITSSLNLLRYILQSNPCKGFLILSLGQSVYLSLLLLNQEQHGVPRNWQKVWAYCKIASWKLGHVANFH